MTKFYLLSAAAIALALPAAAAPLAPATFENLGLAPESYWIGNTGDPDYTSGTFDDGSFRFANVYNAAWGTWGFFGYANLTGNTFTTYLNKADQMTNAVGGGHDSASYAMVYCDAYNGPTAVSIPDYVDEGVTVPGMWVTNAAWVVKAILEGDGLSGAFGQGDLLSIVATEVPNAANAANDEYTPKSVTFNLADYTSDNSDEWYYVNDWRWMDLSALGDVAGITFSMQTTKINDYGPTTPSYFAIDDLGAADTNAVGAIDANDDFRVCSVGGTLNVSGKAAAFSVSAYTTEGRLAASATAVGGHASLSLPAGLYIVRVGNKCIKIMH